MGMIQLYMVLGYCLPLILGSDTEYEVPTVIKLYHSLEDTTYPVWEEAGKIIVQNVNRGNVVTTMVPLSPESKAKLENISRKDLLYRMKAVVTTSKAREIVFYSFLKACALVDSELVNLVTITLDQGGLVVRVMMSTLEPCYEPKFHHLTTSVFNTTVEFKTVDQGPTPDTASYIQKIEREREAKERGATQDNRSFLAKYWMYIIPVVLFAVLSGSTNVEGGNGNSR